MKSRILTCISAMTLLAALAIPVPQYAQEDAEQVSKPKHHHYKLIDIGTLGGPSSYFDDLSLSDRFGFVPSIFEIAPVLNRQGVLAGWADTSAPDPYAPFCFNPDCFVSHAFRWQEGVKSDLGVLSGGASSAALWINAKGLTVGMSQNGVIDPVTGFPELHGVTWQHGQIMDLGTFGGSASYASAVNNHGQVVGTAQNSVPDQYSFFDLLFNFPGSSNGTQTRAFLWDEEHGMQDLGTLGGHDATANLINEHGQVAGFSYTNSIPNPTTGIPTFHPFLWDKEKGMQDLGSLGGTALGSVNGLNERGEVVGATTTEGDIWLHPFLWEGNRLSDLIAPPFGGPGNGEAGWINEAGDIVGLAALGTYCPPGSLDQQPIQHAFFWRKGAITDLGTLSGTTNSEADFINEKGQIVGIVWDCNYNFTAVMWENGSLVDLNALIPANAPFLFASSFIDDHGEIAAFGLLPNGDIHAVLLIPCQEDDKGCGDETASAATTRRSDSTLTVAQRLAISKMTAGSHARLRPRYHIPGT